MIDRKSTHFQEIIPVNKEIKKKNMHKKRWLVESILYLGIYICEQLTQKKEQKKKNKNVGKVTHITL